MKFKEITEAAFEDVPSMAPFGKYKEFKTAISEKKNRGILGIGM